MLHHHGRSEECRSARNTELTLLQKELSGPEVWGTEQSRESQAILPGRRRGRAQRMRSASAHERPWRQGSGQQRKRWQGVFLPRALGNTQLVPSLNSPHKVQMSPASLPSLQLPEAHLGALFLGCPALQGKGASPFCNPSASAEYPCPSGVPHPRPVGLTSRRPRRPTAQTRAPRLGAPRTVPGGSGGARAELSKKALHGPGRRPSHPPRRPSARPRRRALEFPEEEEDNR